MPCAGVAFTGQKAVSVIGFLASLATWPVLVCIHKTKNGFFLGLLSTLHGLHEDELDYAVKDAIEHTLDQKHHCLLI